MSASRRKKKPGAGDWNRIREKKDSHIKRDVKEKSAGEKEGDEGRKSRVLNIRRRRGLLVEGRRKKF